MVGALFPQGWPSQIFTSRSGSFLGLRPVFGPILPVREGGEMFTMGDLVKFKSEAHRRKCHQLVKEGKMSPETLYLMEKEYKPGTLPERSPNRVSATRGTRRTAKVQK